MMRPAVSSSRGRNNCGHRRVARRAIGRHTKMQNVRNVKLPDPRIISGIVQTAVFGGAGAYGLYHSFFNVEGGHRAIVYNRFVGIREKVRHSCVMDTSPACFPRRARR